MTVVAPRDPFSTVVDTQRKLDPEWYTFLTELTEEMNKLSIDLGSMDAAKANRAGDTFTGNVTVQGLMTSNGRTTTPPVGRVGEVLEFTGITGWGPLAGGVWFNPIALVLPAGDWELYAGARLTGMDAYAQTYLTLSSISTGWDGVDGNIASLVAGPGNDAYYSGIPRIRRTISAPTTIYLVHLVGSAPAGGWTSQYQFVHARRMS